MKSAHKSDECSVFGCFLSGVEPLQLTTHSASDEECSLVICCNCLAENEEGLECRPAGTLIRV